MTTLRLLALNQALSEIEVPPPDPSRWTAQLAGVARQLHAVACVNRDIFPAAGPLPGGGSILRCHERVLAIMRAGGLTDSRSVAGLYLLWLIVSGFPPRDDPAGEPGRAGQDLASATGAYFAALPADRFPNLAAVADELADTSPDERFDQVIAIFIDGLAAG